MKILKEEKTKKIISIYSPNNSFPLFPGIKNKDILRLCFNDIDQARYNLKTISQKDIRSVLSFVQKNQDSDILIHCYAGVSRSIAISIIIFFMYNRNFTPSEIYNLIKEKAPFANPNKLVLRQAGSVIKEEKFFQELIKKFTNRKRIFSAMPFYLDF
ncbi:MAG: dual specificity protein phosphatase family protein [Hyphomicrobiales bacterium]|nr:dual specificity protein phosphatase family protein [Hyphomicrobiales bacterium]